MRRKVSGFRYLKQVFSEFSADDILKYSASLSYYTVLSLAPFLIIIIYLCGLLLGKDAIEGHIYSEIKEVVGSPAAIQIQDAIKNIHLRGHNFFASSVSIIILLIGATGIFGEIQDSLNKIWGLRLLNRRKWWKLITDRLLSFSLIVAIGFLLMVSLVLNALITAFGHYISRYTQTLSVTFLQVMDNGLTFIVTWFLFSVIFKVLPDAKIKWKDVFTGGFVTSVFFTGGKAAIGYYLGTSSIANVYGAAGSIIILMLWVYYSSVILFLGAEFTKVHAKFYGGKIFPTQYATWIKIDQEVVANPALKHKIVE